MQSHAQEAYNHNISSPKQQCDDYVEDGSHTTDMDNNFESLSSTTTSQEQEQEIPEAPADVEPCSPGSIFGTPDSKRRKFAMSPIDKCSENSLDCPDGVLDDSPQKSTHSGLNIT